MTRGSIQSLAVAWLLSLSACSGKTERGISGEAPAEKPAAGPSNAADGEESVQSSRAGDRRHLLMVVELELATRTAKILKARRVDLPLPRKRGPVVRGPWQVDVLDAAGKVLYSAPLPDASTLRGEFANEDGQLAGVTTHMQVTGVTLRLPLLEGAARVVVSKLDDGKRPSELGSVAYPQVQP
jgi:hypothetical protein